MLEKFNKKIELPKLKMPKLTISKKAQSVSGGIVSIDAYSQKVYNFADNTITAGGLNFYDKKNFYISYLYSHDIVTGVVEIARGVDDEELNDAIEVGAYDELSLDSAVEYLIKYVEVHIKNSENRVYNVFAIPKDKIIDIFDDLGSVKHVDLVLPSPFLFSALYEKEYLERGKVECFIHFDYEDAFLTIYQDGQYVFSKDLTHSLKKINEEFARLLAQHVDEKEFFKLLQTQGLKTTDSVIQKNLMKIFGDMFSYINDVIMFAKRTNSIDEFDNFYISSKIGEIKGISEFAYNYINLDSKKLDLVISKNSSEINIDPLAELMIIYAKTHLKDADELDLNFSIFQKEPDFFTRPSGKIVKVLAASLVLSLAYPGFEWYETYMFEKEYQELSLKNQALQREVNAMKTALKGIFENKKAIKKRLESKQKELSFRTKLLKEIYNKKVNYAMKAKVLNDLFSKVNRHNSKIEKIENHDREVVLSVRSQNDKDITELIKDIAKNQKYEVSTKLIEKNKKGSFYKSAIKVGINGSF